MTDPLEPDEITGALRNVALKKRKKEIINK